MKLSSAGAIEWSKCFGGSKNDELLDVEIINGKIFAVGYANSIDGDIPPNQKNYDVWLLSLDANGNKIFSKIYGGSQNDVAYSFCKGVDETLTLGGYTTSNDGDVSGAKGSQDYWIINISQNGTLNWQKVLGGSDADYANTIIADSDGGYLAGGVSYSDNGDVTGAKGDGDYWLVKLDSKGTMLWQKSYGGSKADNLHCIIHKPFPDEYYLAGDSESGDGDFNNVFNDADFGIIKLKNPLTKNQDTTVCNINSFVAFTDTLKDVCGFDSMLVTYKPVIISGPLTNIKKQDTIFAGQSITLPYNGNGQPLWDKDPTLSCFACASPVATPAVSTKYTITSSLSNGCLITDYFTVIVLNDAVVMTPNAFTPNNDGLNDFFGPSGKVPDGYLMQIFNRFGQLIYTSSSLKARWNGTFNGSPQPLGVYVYIITYPDLQNKQHQQKGTVTLIR